MTSFTPGAFNPSDYISSIQRPHGPAGPLPMTLDEAQKRGWDELDVVFVTGDAYVDHPSFATAILARVLEAAGFRVGIIAQPNWHSCDSFKAFSRPRLCFAISAGNMDAMLNHYTASRKVRNDDAYSPGGRIGLRPDRATIVYCQRAREAYSGVPIIAGGVEASLRRLAHYDYWSDTVRRSILFDSKADLVVFGMGESAIVEIARRLDRGETVRDLRDMRGVAFAMGTKETPPKGDRVAVLPSYEQIRADRFAFAEATRLTHMETNPYNARTLVQWHDRQVVVCNPPRLPESQDAMDFFYSLPFTRKPHPSYTECIPAHEVIKDSITIMRGCLGGCVYCSITTHQGRIVQSRSRGSVVREVAGLTREEEFKGIVSDLGGPTANMYEMRCLKPEIEAVCRRLSCIHPKVCSLLGTDHGPLVELMKEARAQDGIRKVLIASGVRMDLAGLSPEYIEELVAHHVGGHLKVAPEHADNKTLSLMKRPPLESFEAFAGEFDKRSNEAGKEQYLVPYFIASHPGCDLSAAIELAIFLRQRGYRPEQVQDFIPTPMDIAACMYHTGLDPMTKKPVYVAKFLRDRRLQRALLQFFKPENYFLVRKALVQAGREDLIGSGGNCLIPAKPPAAALKLHREPSKRRTIRVKRREPRRKPAGKGYRPGRATAPRRSRKRSS